MLWREIVRFGFSFLPYQFGLLLVLVHVVRNRSHVVEELRIHRPLSVFLPDLIADEHSSSFSDRLLQGEPLIFYHRVAQSLIESAILVGGWRRGRKPAFVNSSTVQAIGVEVVWMKFETFARLQERARDPARGQPQKPAGIGERTFNKAFDAFFDGLEGGNGSHWFEIEDW